jgi:hypothetical protein
MRPQTIVTLAALLVAAPAAAQSGGFVVTLGKDTLHAERFTRTASAIEGMIVTRSPVTAIARYRLDLDANGRPTRYEVRTNRADGTPVRTPGANAWMTLAGDTLLRETMGAEKPDTQRIPAPSLVMPGPSLPYVGVSYLMYELAFADAKKRADAKNESSMRLITMNPRQVSTFPTKVWFIGNDSAELDYFGVTRSGWKFATDGSLTRADWTNTTYRYRIVRTGVIDVESIAQGWNNADKAGAAMGALSPRDTARGSTGSVNVLVDYARPSKRGRTIWGDVVPHGKVWRLGADFATHVVFSGDVTLGEAAIPAGTYTLWMLPAADGTAQLIVNKQVRIFGTNYNPGNDLVRIPLRRESARAPVERLTIEIADGRFWIRWDEVAWSAPVTPR